MSNLFRRLQARIQARTLADLLLAKARSESAVVPLPVSEPFAIINEDIKQIKLSAYIACVVHEDYSKLILAGTPNDKQLATAWAGILSQCFEISSDENIGKYLETTGQMYSLAMRMNIVRSMSYALKVAYSQDAITEAEISPIIESLHNAGYKYPFSRHGHLKDLERVATGEKRNEVLYNRLKKEKTSQKDIIKTEASFYEKLAALRKYEDYKTDDPVMLAESLTVYGYYEAMNRYNKHLLYLQTQSK